MTDMRPWQLVLIVEDDTDGWALRALAERCGFEGTVDWLPANGIGNIKRRGRELIALARARLGGAAGCVSVVVDGDGRDVDSDDPLRAIAHTCRREGVRLVVAREALEAWLLADGGVAQWLDRSPSRRADQIRHPKRDLAQAYYRKTGRPYSPRLARRKLAAQVDGSGASRSASLRAALSYVQDSGCRVQQL